MKTTQLDTAELSNAIESMRQAPNRLVLLVGPHGSGKTRHLKALAAEYGHPYIRINASLSEELKSIPRRRRPAGVRSIVSDTIAEADGRVVLVDNIELLFLPELSQNPIQLLNDLARNRTLCVAWPGRLDADGALTYAEPGHPEHKRYADHRVMCVPMPHTL